VGASLGEFLDLYGPVESERGMSAAAQELRREPPNTLELVRLNLEPLGGLVLSDEARA
jgi:hypothetical protein